MKGLSRLDRPGRVAVDGWDGFLMREGQIESIVYGMIERLAVLRGQDEPAAHWRQMALRTYLKAGKYPRCKIPGRA
ncbi:hypothetical protein ABZ897_03445 [Nonomuraea sp. NPDC046802]|uniref:hypothetical protein n=1 Tax=Nonomuraea sp. NPDC046802 TaxID=3154919 RepID=UPI0033C24256